MKRTPLTRSTPPKRQKRRDPVTPELREAVLSRDNYQCVAGRMEFTEAWLSPEVDRALLFTGNAYIPLPACSGPLTLDHVKSEPRMGVRAPSDMEHLVTLCAFHHLESGWATSHRPELREYLIQVSAPKDGAKK